MEGLLGGGHNHNILPQKTCNHWLLSHLLARFQQHQTHMVAAAALVCRLSGWQQAQAVCGALGSCQCWLSHEPEAAVASSTCGHSYEYTCRATHKRDAVYLFVGRLLAPCGWVRLRHCHGKLCSEVCCLLHSLHITLHLVHLHPPPSAAMSHC